MHRRWFVAVGVVAILTASVPAASGEAPADAPATPIRIAIYDHSDGAAKAPPALMRILTEPAGFQCRRVRPEDIRGGSLADCRVLIVPGGSGSKQAENLQPEGREAIRSFVRGGGGYVGICAGSYLASSDYEWSLGILNAKVLDRAHWARGTGTVRLVFTPWGQEALAHSSRDVDVYYGQGPLLAPDTKRDLPPFEPLARYDGEIVKKTAQPGVMAGATAIARAAYGNGRVICFSPHPEVSGGPNHLISAGVRWAAGVDAPRQP